MTRVLLTGVRGKTGAPLAPSSSPGSGAIPSGTRPSVVGMTSSERTTAASSTDHAGVVDWLLAGDPAIRWQTMRDLPARPPHRSPPSAPASRPRGGAPGCSRCATPTGSGPAAPASRGRSSTTGGPASSRTSPTVSPGPRRFPVLRVLRDLGPRPGQSLRRGRPIRAGGGELPLGARRPGVLRRRGGALHQRPDARDRRPTSVPTSTAWSPGCSAAARRRRLELRDRAAARRCPRSTPRSASSRACSTTSGPGERCRSPTPGDAGRSTSSSATSSAVGAPARS